jgi:hypothetical protein
MVNPTVQPIRHVVHYHLGHMAVVHSPMLSVAMITPTVAHRVTRVVQLMEHVSGKKTNYQLLRENHHLR